MEIKKFKGPKMIELIRAQCALQELVCDSTLYDQERSDYIIVFSPIAPLGKVFYSDLTGRFFGTNDHGVMFDSAQPLDDEPWFIALLDFFMEPLPGGTAPEAAASTVAIAYEAFHG